MIQLFKKIKITTRLTIIIVAVLMCFTVLSGFAINSIMTLNKLFESVVNELTIASKQSINPQLIQDSIKPFHDYGNFTMLMLIVITSFFVVCGLTMTICIAISIKSSLKELLIASNKIAKGELDVTLSLNNRDEIAEVAGNYKNVIDTIKSFVDEVNNAATEYALGNSSFVMNTKDFKGVYKEMLASVSNLSKIGRDDLESILNVLSCFSKGEFEADLPKMYGDKIVANEVINLMRSNIVNVVNDIIELSKQVSKGNLSIDLKSNGYNGKWRELIVAVNELMEITLQPIQEASNVLGKVAQGELSAKVMGDYEGENALMKNNLNNTTTIISDYIQEIRNTLLKISQKNLTVSIQKDFIGDFKEIKDSINLIIKELSETMLDIEKMSQKLFDSANYSKSISSNISKGAELQNEALVELDKSVSMIITATKESTSNAQKAALINTEVQTKAIAANKKMDETMTAMEEIKISSNKVSDIIKAIHDIASQTNLLALNASIEAARAGIHGKGFSVVAQEVRELSGKSNQAAKESETLIQQTLDKINSGYLATKETSRSLDDISSELLRISNIVDKISSQSDMYEKYIGDVSSNINNILQVTKENLRESNNNEVHAEDLLEQSQNLHEKVDSFVLNKR